MSEKYIPLYRKYRPKNLQEVVGQEHIKTALTNAIKLNKITHAYLFTGPRGTGKTSVARILAKSLNCKNGPTITPCEECASCIDIKNSTLIDVIEIDAASNRKVEDTQNILEKIQYVPVNGKYKIYIIDEVHMLTNHAFNSLLKTLEEPPENVIFILATTEPHKVLETITSRCQRFDFRRITTEDIVAHLKNIAKKEKIKIDDDALFTIAKNASGGMRDSLALLDQVSVLDSSKNITTDDVNKLLGRLSFDTLNDFCNFIINASPQEAIELLEKVYNSGNEPSQILLNLLEYFKNLLIVKNCKKDELLIDLTQLNNNQIELLKIKTELIETHQISFLIEKTIYYIKEIKTTTNQHLWLEIAVIDLANLAQNTSLLNIQERLSKLEEGKTQNVSSQPYISKVIEPVSSVTNEIIEKPLKMANIEEAKLQEATNEGLPPMPVMKSSPKDNKINDFWIQLLQNISSTPTVSLLTQHAKPLEISEEKIIIGCKENFLKLLSSESKKSAIEDGAKKLFNKSVNVVIKTASLSDIPDIGEKKNPIISKSIQEFPKQEKNQPDTQENEEEDFIENELAKNYKKDDKILSSDQVTMVMNLFDGKYIE